MPMWCPSSDAPRPPNGITQPHHRIVRVPPGESVVLNSAERAPYLLLIEILNDDLDFDPAKRNNKEVLKNIVTKKDERAGASRDLASFPPTPAPLKGRTNSSLAGGETFLGDDDGEPLTAVLPTTPMNAPPEEEEIDLVEQLYGTDHSLRSRAVDLSELIVLPPAPKNKDLDMAAWSRTSSNPTSEQGSSAAPSAFAPRQTFPPPLSVSTANNESQFLSLDEYSERMRTAAIMLSQLNANLIREPVTAVPLPGVPATPIESEVIPGSRWIPGSGWLLGASENKGPLQTPLNGGAGDNTATLPLRMKLQHSEAAAIRDRIMKEMLALEDERMERMREHRDGEETMQIGDSVDGFRTAEDESIIRRELKNVDPSAIVFSESWAEKKVVVIYNLPLNSPLKVICISEQDTTWFALRSSRCD
jgi:phosphatidylinositol 4-kinase B